MFKNHRVWNEKKSFFWKKNVEENNKITIILSALQRS